MKMKLEYILRKGKIITWHFTGAQKNILLHSEIILGGLVLVSLAIITALSIQNVSATEEFQSSQDVSFTFEPTISLYVSSDSLSISDLAPGTYSDSNVITVTASSNAVAGYSVSSTVGNSTYDYSTLKNSSDSSYVFNNLTGNVSALSSFSDSYWGYSYSICTATSGSGSSTTCTNTPSWISGDVTSTTASGYNGLASCTSSDVSECSGTYLISKSSNGSSSVQFKIGAKASSTQASGTYSNVINFVSVANANPSQTYYYYGDGSLNKTQKGYMSDNLYLNGQLYSWTADTDTRHNYYSTNIGFFNAPINSEYATLDGVSQGKSAWSMFNSLSYIRHNYTTTGSVNGEALRYQIQSGTNEYNFKISVDTSSEDRSIFINLQPGAWTRGVSVSDLYFQVDDTYYSLSQMVANGIIEPLVLMDGAGWPSSYYWSTPQNLYDNSGSTGTGDYPGFKLLFILKTGHVMTSIKLYSNKTWNIEYNDGYELLSVPASEFRFTLNAY